MEDDWCYIKWGMGPVPERGFICVWLDVDEWMNMLSISYFQIQRYLYECMLQMYLLENDKNNADHREDKNVKHYYVK